MSLCLSLFNLASLPLFPSPILLSLNLHRRPHWPSPSLTLRKLLEHLRLLTLTLHATSSTHFASPFFELASPSCRSCPPQIIVTRLSWPVYPLIPGYVASFLGFSLLLSAKLSPFLVYFASSFLSGLISPPFSPLNLGKSLVTAGSPQPCLLNLAPSFLLLLYPQLPRVLSPRQPFSRNSHRIPVLFLNSHSESCHKNSLVPSASSSWSKANVAYGAFSLLVRFKQCVFLLLLLTEWMKYWVTWLISLIDVVLLLLLWVDL